jgi:diguanylate cyclase (GGDEF)-like protein
VFLEEAMATPADLLESSVFGQRASAALSAAYARGSVAALLFVDLDNFRLLRNGYGHRVAEQLLLTVAERTRSVIGEPHFLCRLGGDELVALLVDIPRPDVALETAKALIVAICEPARVLGVEVSVTPSVGIAIFPQDGVDLDSLLNAAYAAMYHAKESGGCTYALYTPAVARKIEIRLRLEQRLRQGGETRDFHLLYQPLVSLLDGKMIGAECLVRWTDAELGEIPPDEFVKVAEESGLIVELGDWVLREACRSRQVWRGLGLEVPPISINMAGAQLEQLSCVDRLLETLAEFGVAPSEIEIELTETGLFQSTDIGRENLVRLRNAGIRLALDNFGIGYSSLSHLRELPINSLKIDRRFTVECVRDARTLTIVKAVIEMARSLGIAVTAEGIENQAQQTWMQHLGCDAAQGFLFARPMPAEDFLKLFIDRRADPRARPSLHRPDDAGPSPAASGTAVERPAPTPPAARLGEAIRGRAKDRRILVAEDNYANQAYFSELLKHVGLRLALADNGAKAVELALSQHFDLVFMDVNMPVMDGIEATRRIRAAIGKALPIVGLSAHALPGDRERLLAAGMDEVLASPYLPESFFAILLRWLPPGPAEGGSK